MFYAAVLCPIEAEAHTESRMQPTESPLAESIMEDVSQKMELPVAVAKPVTVSDIKGLVTNLHCEGTAMQNHAALLLQIIEAPDIVITSKVMYFDAHIGQFADFAEEACIALWHNRLIFEPEVEHVAEHIDDSGLVLYLIEEAHQAPFLLAAVRNCETAQMSVTDKVNVFHLSIVDKLTS